MGNYTIAIRNAPSPPNQQNLPLALIPVLWFHFPGNGFIEAGELDEFLKSLWKEGHPGKVKRRMYS